MVTTREEAKKALEERKKREKEELDYIVSSVLEQGDDSNISKALEQHGCRSVIDLITSPDALLEALDFKYTDKDGNQGIVELINYEINILKQFVKFYAYLLQQGRTFTGDGDFKTIATEEFRQFRISPVANPLPPPPGTNPTTQRTPIDPIREWKRGIKRDQDKFPTLKRDAGWKVWNNLFVTQANAQDVGNVLDPTYNPTTITEKALFAEQQKFMLAVFADKLQTDKGKALVQQYSSAVDAQSIYRELKKYSLRSTQAEDDAEQLMNYLLTS